MAYVTRRLLSTTVPRRSSAAAACSEIFERFGNKPISIKKQLFDANQVQQLSLTLGRSNLHEGIRIANDAPPEGTPIPPGYHLVYFTPTFLEEDLGSDGTDKSVNPLAPFTRRMWAGGELEWSQDPSQFLRVGQVVQETTNMLSAEPKKLKTGAEMLVVGVEKTYETEKGVALVDRRNWVFQKEITEAKAPPPKPDQKPLPEGDLARDFQQTDVTLFRFSALTLNGHKIHYSKEWCREVEGHRDCVVHGPMNLINILDFWRDTARNAAEDAVPKSIAYRAMSPLYAGEPYRILLEKGAGGYKADVWDSFGKQAMKGTIVE
jgi:hydroxyacyl-ACP dehydratase HTD2-like protein with hotdog domain